MLVETTKKVNQKVIMLENSFYSPDTIMLELTHACPLRCRHCFLSAGKGNSADFDKLSIVADKLLSLGAYKFQLTGGEPLFILIYMNL
ncbi:MAG: hypothetical protein LBP35_01430 [Candidatus Ancillula trichonymphae]|jgi:MoaA/NifB/PqqE/SkfB family radical SAM enzyme|nr:hypothetical protein [Candidatus Ancillula trichonymphae]